LKEIFKKDSPDFVVWLNAKAQRGGGGSQNAVARASRRYVDGFETMCGSPPSRGLHPPLKPLKKVFELRAPLHLRVSALKSSRRFQLRAEIKLWLTTIPSQPLSQTSAGLCHKLHNQKNTAFLRH